MQLVRLSLLVVLAAPALASTIYGTPKITHPDLDDPNLTVASAHITAVNYTSCATPVSSTEQTVDLDLDLDQSVLITPPAGTWCQVDVYLQDLTTTVPGHTESTEPGWTGTQLNDEITVPNNPTGDIEVSLDPQ